MPIFQAGTLNTTALVVPDLYVVIVPPQNLVINGVPSNVVGVVGTASWGPVGIPTVVGNMADYARLFGAVQARKYDMGTVVATAVQQGAAAFRCVRVTDGTDLAATATLGSTFLTATALYSGTLGNSVSLLWTAGSKSGTYRLIVTPIYGLPEVFDNIAGTGNAVAIAAAAAVNTGSGALRGPSQLITMAAGVGTTVPTNGTSVTLSGGTDGVATLTASVLVGLDTVPRKGMYALRGAGCSIGVLADADDSTQWTTIDGFGLFEGIYMMQVMPSGGTNPATAATTKGTAGLDSYASKLLLGDWIYWNDQTNNQLRLVSPQGFVAGRLANLSPEQSSLNKQLYGVVGTQKSGIPRSGAFASYSSAELAVLGQAGIDLIANPQPGGSYWGVRFGHNSSSSAAVQGDNYTRMTNYIASTLNAGMGVYVGMLINSGLFRRVRSTLLGFLQALLGQGILGSTDGNLPFAVVCDITNNPNGRTELGYLQADVSVRYQAINERFIVNLEGGQTVQVARQTLPSGQV